MIFYHIFDYKSRDLQKPDKNGYGTIIPLQPSVSSWSKSRVSSVTLGVVTAGVVTSSVEVSVVSLSDVCAGGSAPTGREFSSVVSSSIPAIFKALSYSAWLNNLFDIRFCCRGAVIFSTALQYNKKQHPHAQNFHSLPCFRISPTLLKAYMVHHTKSVPSLKSSIQRSMVKNSQPLSYKGQKRLL